MQQTDDLATLLAPVEGRYVDLFDGKLERVVMAVQTGGLDLRELNSDPQDGLYVLTAVDFRTICTEIAATRGTTGREIAVALDDVGPGNRWFRMSPAVAEWINRSQPIGRFFDHIG